MERETGFEPATSTLARSPSTTELLPLSTTDYNKALRTTVKFVPFHTSRRAASIARPLRIVRSVHDFAIAHVNDPVSKACCLRIMSDHQHRLAELLVRLAQHVEHNVG